MKAREITEMDKLKKLELVQRSLGIRHKLKVHESMKTPDNHEDLAIMLLSKWDLEDELRAIEEMLNDLRTLNVRSKRSQIEKEGVHVKSLGASMGPGREETAPRKKAKKF